MRRDGIPYVANGVYNPPFPAVPLQDLTLEEIKKKYLKMCAKSNGDPSVCSKCANPCAEGKRAIQLIANTVYNDPPVPLYGGKTLIERAKEENMRRREEEAKKNMPAVSTQPKKSKNGRMFMEGWYEKAMESDDPVAWVVNTFSISRTKAKAKIYQWKIRHATPPEETTVQEVEPPKPSVVPEQKTETKNSEIESKLEKLMKLQEDQKKAMDEYLKLYKEAEKEYNKIKEQTDILCRAMDIMNDI